MKKILLIVLLIFCSNIIAQESLIGNWKTIEANGSHFSIDRNDSIVLYDNYKRTKVSEQDNKAFIRSDYSNNIFVFAIEGDFKLYRNENPRSLEFVGKYTLQNQNILFKVKNKANIELNKKAEFYFKKGELYLKMYAEGNSPINFVLERIEN